MAHKPIPKIPKRKCFWSNKVNGVNQEYGTEEDLKLVPAEQANLVSSLVDEQTVPQFNDKLYALHAPVIDFDIPIEVLPSTQLGHYHLYIHKAIPWNRYKLVLNALKYAELVEPGYVDASAAKGFSAVRPPGVVKLDPPKGSKVLIENAKLRRENFELKQQLLELKTQVQNENIIQKAAKAPAQI